MASICGLACLWLLALTVFLALCIQLGAWHAYGKHIRAQLVCAIAFSHILATWIVAEVAKRCAVGRSKGKPSYELAVTEPDTIGAAAPDAQEDSEAAKTTVEKPQEELSAGD